MITAEFLLKYLAYDSDNGLLTWKERTPDDFKGGKYCPQRRCDRWNTRYANKRVGADNGKGYLTFRLFKKTYKVHRIVMFLELGYWPEFVDHINGIRDDNRLVNLREVSKTENARNAKLRIDNTIGTPGIYHRGKWEVRISENGKQKCIGRFDNKLDAVTARQNAQSKLGYHQNHGRKIDGS
jgi:hypothetical protein